MTNPRIQALLTELRDAYDGEPWYSDSLRATLEGIDAARANAKPLAGAHSIAELVAHITAWIEVMNRRLDGEVFEVTMDVNFRTPGTWTDDLQRLDAAHNALLGRVSAMADADLDRKLAGKPHTIEFGVRGVAQHNIYHQGQIALLNKG